MSFATIDELQQALVANHYVADRPLATAIFLALKLQKPLLLEGEAGVGKTEVAKTLAQMLDRRLIRLQCYEGLDVNTTIYEWNYTRQMLQIRLLESMGASDSQAAIKEIFGPEFLIKRPLLQAIEESRDRPPVLLIDEIDRADEEFEAFLLELLSDWQISIPELGTIRAAQPPVVIITSNRTREVHDALKRRCLFYWIDYPSLEKEQQIVSAKRAGRLREAFAPGGRLRAGAAQARPLQATGRRRDAGLDHGAGGTRRAGAHRRRGRGHAGRDPQVPGRHHPSARRRHPGAAGEDGA